MRDVVFATTEDSAPEGLIEEYRRRLIALLPAYGMRAQALVLPRLRPGPTHDEALSETHRLLQAYAENTHVLIESPAYSVLPNGLVLGTTPPLIPLVHHFVVPIVPAPQHGQAVHSKTAEPMALSRAGRLIATSAAIARRLIDQGGVRAENIRIALPGTEPAPRASGTGTPLHVLAVGAVTSERRYDRLVAALAALSPSDWRLTIAGALDREPKAVAALRSALAAADFEDRVELAGHVVPATLERLYASADIFVRAGPLHGFDRDIAAAMARGVPVLCPEDLFEPDLVPETAALKFPPEDQTALTAALAAALKDRKLRRRLADGAWEAGRQLPTWNETARRVVAALIGFPPSSSSS